MQVSNERTLWAMFVQCRGSLGLKLRQQSTSPAGYLTPSVNWAVYNYRAPSEAGFVLPCMNELGLGCSVALGRERSSIAAVIVFPSDGLEHTH